MRSGEEIYVDIAGILLLHRPAGSLVLKYGFWVIAENGSEEGGAYKYEFDYVSETGAENWFSPKDVAAKMALCDLCFELRDVMFKNTGGKWREIRFSFNIEDLRFSTQFRYD